MRMAEARQDRSAGAPLVAEFSGFLAERIGLHFPPARHDELRLRMEGAARHFGQPDADACMGWLMAAPLAREQVEALAGQLTVGETYFFREPDIFQAIAQRILPELIRARAGRRRLRLWSAGCSSGEEAYSLAIALERMGEVLEGWEVTLLATDINPGFLRKGAEACYGEWSFRGVEPELKERYFKRNHEGRHELAARIRDRVNFAYLNLAEDAFPSLLTNTTAIDLILCRNVLMYFAPEVITRIGARLRDALSEDGALFVGAAETLLVRPAGMRSEQFGGVTVFRKSPPSAPDRPVPVARFWREAPRAPALVLPPRIETPGTRAIPPPVRATPERSADTPQSLAQLARRHANAGDLEAALECSGRALAADKLDPAAHYLHALIEIEIGRTEDAARALRRAIFLDRGFVMAHFALASLCLARGEGPRARQHVANARMLLVDYAPQDPVPEAEGMSAARLLAALASMQELADGRG